MKHRELRRLLQTVPLPEEFDGRRRSWPVVLAAFDEREPVRRRRPSLRPVVALAVVAGLVAAAFSPAGEAVVERARKAIGIEKAAPALFSLPAPGRLLVDSDAGPWIVQRDGSRRLLGRYDEASWSPRGLFVVAARRNELAALAPDGDVRWSLARPRVSFPRWGGSLVDTRIAYLAGSRLRVVAGDGTGDGAACGERLAAPVAPAWRPGTRHVVAYVTVEGHVVQVDTDRCAVPSRSARFAAPRLLAWSSDGSRLLLVTEDRLAVFRGGRAKPLAVHRLAGVQAAEFSPTGDRIAIIRGDDVFLLDADRPRAALRRVFAGAGGLTGLAWSPDGRWLLVAWEEADQWVFVRVSGARRIQAVSDVSAQFRSTSFPSVAGWCCPR